MRPVRSRVPGDYRKRGGVHTVAAARLTELENEAVELRRRLNLSRKRRTRLLRLVEMLDLEVERLTTDGSACSAVADYLEDAMGKRFRRPSTASFTRRVLLPEDIRAGIAARSAKARQPSCG